MSRISYVQVTDDAGRRFFSDPPEGPVVMLNLLKFSKVADYSLSPELDPGETISGAEAYRRYLELAGPMIREGGADVIFQGKPHLYLIGPQAEDWDLLLLVKHDSATKFLAFARNEEYLKIAGHRTAALADSRLLPVSTIESPGS